MRSPPQLLAFASVAALLALGCEGGTGAPLVEVSIEAAPYADANGALEVGAWRVELEEAHVLVGPVYLFAPPQTPLMAEVRAWLRSTARAHAGDDNLDGVRVIGELLDPVPVDALMRAPIPFGVTVAEGLELDRVVLVLDEPRGEHLAASSPTRGHHAWMRVRATRGDRVLRFEAGLDIRRDRIARRVEGLRIVGAPVLRDGATLRVRPRPGEWVRRVDLDALAEVLEDVGDDAEVPRVEAPSQLHNAWYLGLRGPEAWRVELEQPEPR